VQHYRQRRHLSRREVSVVRGKQSWDAMIIDATAEGFRISGANLPLMLEDRIALKTSSWSVDATVVWIRDGSVGVSLLSPLAPMDLARLTGKSMRLNRKSRVGFHH
jgi:hypothetical protein